MQWSELTSASPLVFSGLLECMERWQPGSTKDLEPATDEMVEELASPLEEGVDTLPLIYREFLASMGVSTGWLRLMWGSTSVTELLADRKDKQRKRPDSQRYFMFALGEDDINGRHPDDFFDLAKRTQDGVDAAIIRISERDLSEGGVDPKAPFATFSDLLRAVITAKLGLQIEDDRSVGYFDFGTDPEAPERVYDFLVRLGFSHTKLGASTRVVPLEASGRAAIALLKGPSPSIPRTALRLRSTDPQESAQLKALMDDYQGELRG